MWTVARRRWRPGRRLCWAVEGRRSQVTAKRCAVSTLSSCPVCVWSPPTTYRLAWSWRKRGGRQESEPAAVAEAELAAAQAQAELSVAPALLALVARRGRVVTGDALYCQRALSQQIQAAYGHYLFVIKANQPELLAEVALLFDRPP